MSISKPISLTIDDGLPVFIDIVDPPDHDVLVHKRRAWFVKGINRL